MRSQIRRRALEWLKTCCRDSRARLLSVGLRGKGPFLLSESERQASEAFSVIVAVHDAPVVTRRCLQSLERFGDGAEVIIVDDASKLETVKAMLDGFCARNGWKLVRHNVALGHSRASEAGMGLSARPYACLLNSDTVITPHSWQGILAAFQSDALIAVCGPSTSHTVGPQCIPRASYCRHYWTDEQIWRFAEKYTAGHEQKPLVDLPMVGGFAFFVRRTAWDAMGGFDKNLVDYGNETELCRRLIHAGYRVVWTKAGYIHHLGNESYGQTIGAAEIRRRCVESKAYIARKSTAAS